MDTVNAKSHTTTNIGTNISKYICVRSDVGWGYVPVPEGLPVPMWLHKEVNNL